MPTLYTLRSGPYWYVGTTTDLPARLRAHNGGHGAAWTRKHGRAWRLVDSRPVDPDLAGLHEDMATLALLRAHGPDVVRGGQFSRCTLGAEQIRYIQAALRHNDGLCLRCGAAGHWVGVCPWEWCPEKLDVGWLWLAIWCALWVLGSCGLV